MHSGGSSITASSISDLTTLPSSFTAEVETVSEEDGQELTLQTTAPLTRLRRKALAVAQVGTRAVPDNQISRPDPGESPSINHSLTQEVGNRIPPPTPSRTNQEMAHDDLPARNERAAPVLDASQRGGLERYFLDLEALLKRKGVTDEKDLKDAATRYLDIQTEQLWKSTKAWGDPTKTLADLKEEVFKLYPRSLTDRAFTLQDLDLLSGQYSLTGIRSDIDLGEFYHKFLVISRNLMEKGRLTSSEQSRIFLRGLTANLEQQTRLWLQLRYPEHFRDDPYELDQIYEAANYVLAGSAITPMAPITPMTRPPNYVTTPNNTDRATAKIEALAAELQEFKELLKVSIKGQGPPAGSKPRPAEYATSGTGAPDKARCRFCNVTGHFIRDCEAVQEEIKAGKCKRDQDGRVILATGASIPRNTPGSCIRDKLDEWHRRNPGQLAAQLFFEITPTMVTSPEVVADQASCHPTDCVEQPHATEPAGIFTLNRPKRTRLEVAIDSQPPRKRGRVDQGEKTTSSDSEATHRAKDKDSAPHAVQETEESTATDKVAKETIHPYAAIPDAINPHITGHIRPVARDPVIVPQDPAFSTVARIHDPKVARTIFNRTLEIPITITQRELFSIAPEVRAQIADATVRKRIPRDPIAQAMIEELPNNDDLVQSSDLSERSKRCLAHMPETFATTVLSTTAGKDIEAYFSTEYKSPQDQPVLVAAESNALRAILPVVDGQDKIEAILDPGCQIVAMSEEIANALALSYDPTIKLNMISANGGIDQSLGLARNVPFLVGDITLYFQVHILRGPAYDILLGRPFDVLTQSVVRNFTNETQTITIVDPNSGRLATVPTIKRGTFRFADRRAQAEKFKPLGQGF